MRKIVYFLFAGSLLLMAACQRESLPTPPSQDVVEMDFSVGLEATKGALSSGKDVTDLYVLLFNASGTLLSTSEPYHSENQTWKVKLSISKDTPYTVVFWAQYHPGEGETSIYSLSDKWVQVKQYYVNTGLESKDPADAFWGKVAIPASGDHPTNVSLVRPFAQLSVLVPEASYSTSYSMLDGFFVDAWWGFPNAMNLYNGQVLTADMSNVRFPASGKVNITPVDETLGEATFKRMASVYLFTNEGSTRLMDVSFTIEEDNGTQHTKNLTDVPLQRNVRTVITTTVK